MPEYLRLIQSSPSFGCDPEFFFTQKGDVIGAEKVLPKEEAIDYINLAAIKAKGIVLDGVQAEFNPRPNACRANLGNDMKLCFMALKKRLQEVGNKEIKASFASVVKVDQKELDSLSEKAKKFGCAPSFNSHDATATITVSGDKYLHRAAGGHIHIGGLGYSITKILKDKPGRLADILDILVGNTCVLIDRAPGAVERRKHYGRAGEYRLPKHGFEYRTLSNFWLRSYQLMSLVMGLTRMGIAVLEDSVICGGNWRPATDKEIKEIAALGGYTDPYRKQIFEYAKPTWNPEEELLALIDMKDIVRAINENDLELAKANWNRIKGFIATYAPDTTGDGAMGIPKQHIEDFEYFFKVVVERGLEHWFPEDPIEHWCNMPEGHDHGWETFLSGTVAEQRLSKVNG